MWIKQICRVLGKCLMSPWSVLELFWYIVKLDMLKNLLWFSAKNVEKICKCSFTFYYSILEKSVRCFDVTFKKSFLIIIKKYIQESKINSITWIQFRKNGKV